MDNLLKLIRNETEAATKENSSLETISNTEPLESLIVDSVYNLLIVMGILISPVLILSVII